MPELGVVAGADDVVEFDDVGSVAGAGDDAPEPSVDPEVVDADGVDSFAGAAAGTARDSPAASVAFISPSPWS